MVGLLRILDRLSETLGRITGWFAVMMVLVTCYIVLMRYVFDAGSIAIQELNIYLNTMLFTLGAAYTLKHDAHVRVDIFYSSADKRVQALINLAGSLLLLIPVVLFIIVYCWDYVAASWAIREQSGDPGGLPWVYLLKSLILVMGFLLLLQGVAEILRSVLQIKNSNPAEVSGADIDEKVQL